MASFAHSGRPWEEVEAHIRPAAGEVHAGNSRSTARVVVDGEACRLDRVGRRARREVRLWVRQVVGRSCLMACPLLSRAVEVVFARRMGPCWWSVSDRADRS